MRGEGRYVKRPDDDDGRCHHQDEHGDVEDKQQSAENTECRQHLTIVPPLVERDIGRS